MRNYHGVIILFFSGTYAGKLGSTKILGLNYLQHKSNSFLTIFLRILDFFFQFKPALVILI
jgi:hypothetical protein